MRAFTIHVRPDFGPAQASARPVEVNLVAVTDAELTSWSNYSMSQYWSPNDPRRKSADKVVLQFSREQAAARPQALHDNDPIWARWKSRGAMHLLVLAYLPDVTDDRPGNRDPRRLILPLDCSRWSDITHLKLAVRPTGVVTLTPPRPAADDADDPLLAPQRGARELIGITPMARR
jgi:hypothetical protein